MREDHLHLMTWQRLKRTERVGPAQVSRPEMPEVTDAEGDPRLRRSSLRAWKVSASGPHAACSGVADEARIEDAERQHEGTSGTV